MTVTRAGKVMRMDCTSEDAVASIDGITVLSSGDEDKEKERDKDANVEKRKKLQDSIKRWQMTRTLARSKECLGLDPSHFTSIKRAPKITTIL